MKRVRSVDVLRGFALMAMVLIHFVIYFGDEGAMNTWPYFLLNDLLADFGAAGFLTMVGISQVLSAARTPDADALFLFKKAALRGAYIFTVGLLMLALTWGPRHIWQWDILTLIGFATFVLYFCRFLPSWLILLLSAGAGLITPWLRSLIDPAAVWGAGFMPTPVISDYLPGLFVMLRGEIPITWQWDAILRGFLLAGEFPVFPWIAFPLLGFVLGRRIVARRFAQDLPWLVMLGVLFTVLGVAGAWLSRGQPDAAVVTAYLAPLSFYPDSFTLWVCQAGVTLVVFCSLYYWYDVRPPAAESSGWLTTLYNRTSRFSLTFYFLHYLLIGWTLALVFVVTGEYRVFDLMGIWGSILAGLAAVIALELLLKVWEERGGRYSLEWLLAALTARLTRSLPEPRSTV
jgi:uncharacterized membrane protein